MKVANGDYEGAYSVFRKSVNDGTFSNSQAEFEIAKLKDNELANAKRQQRENIQMMITADPHGVLENLNKAETGEQTDLGDLKPTEKAYYKNLAGRQIRSNQVDAWNSLIQKIQSGDIPDKDQLSNDPDAKWIDPIKYKKLEKAIELAHPIPFDPQAASDLKTRVLNYDPSSDKNDSKFWELAQEIPSKLPKDHAQRLMDELTSSWKKGFNGETKDPREKWKADSFSEIRRLGSSGLLGETGLGPDGKTIVDLQKRNAYNAKEYTIIQGMEKWWDNPANKDKTPTDAQEYRDRLIEPLLKGKALELFKQKSPPSWWSGSSYVESISSHQIGTKTPKPTPTPPPENEAIEKGKINKSKSAPNQTDLKKKAQKVDFETPLPEMPS